MSNVISLEEYRKKREGSLDYSLTSYDMSGDTITYTLTIGDVSYNVTVNTEDFFDS